MNKIKRYIPKAYSEDHIEAIQRTRRKTDERRVSQGLFKRRTTSQRFKNIKK